MVAGLRFLRLLYLLEIPEILQMLSLLRAPSHIRLAQIGSIFISVWMTSTGFAHLVSLTPCFSIGTSFRGLR